MLLDHQLDKAVLPVCERLGDGGFYSALCYGTNGRGTYDVAGAFRRARARIFIERPRPDIAFSHFLLSRADFSQLLAK